MISKVLLSHRDLAGVHFTGSTEVFNNMWKTIGASMSTYRSYPRIVGETGGKDFIVAHASADVDALAVAMVRGGFEFQGQKCSAASRVYVPKSIWNARPRSRGRDDQRDQDGRPDRLPQLHGRGDRQARVRQDQRLHRARPRQREDPGRRQDRRQQGLLRQPDADRNRRPRLQAAVRGNLRTGAHRARLRRCEVGGDAEDRWTRRRRTR